MLFFLIFPDFFRDLTSNSLGISPRCGESHSKPRFPCVAPQNLPHFLGIPADPNGSPLSSLFPSCPSQVTSCGFTSGLSPWPHPPLDTTWDPPHVMEYKIPPQKRHILS